MKERPILFSGAMVRAILEGRKSVTRRIVKIPDLDYIGPGQAAYSPDDPECWGVADEYGDYWYLARGMPHSLPCPYGAPGDRLWVRETWGLVRPGDPTDWYDDRLARWPLHLIRASWDLAYRADWGPHQEACHWRPSIHMPRWASRITLEVTGIRVERLQAITDEDARAEGADLEAVKAMLGGRDPVGLSILAAVQPTARDYFLGLWTGINGFDSWNANPWVWVVSFKRVTP